MMNQGDGGERGLQGEHLASLYLAMNQAVSLSVTDLAGVITEVNDRFCAVSKYGRDELLGQDHRILNSGLHPAGFFEAMWKDVLDGRVWRGLIRNRAKDGTEYWVDSTVTPVRDLQGAITGFLSIRTDVTRQVQDQEALRESRRALAREAAFARSIFDSMDAHMAVINAEGTILDVNAAWMAFARENGATEATVRGAGTSYFTACSGGADPDGILAGIRDVQRGERPSFGTEYTCDSGTEQRWFFMGVAPVPGHPGTVLISHQNITARKQLEASLARAERERRHADRKFAQSQKLESLGSLAGGVAHDMNNVLGAILITASAQMEQLAEGSPGHRAFDTISRAAHRGGDMVKNLLKFAHREPAEKPEEEVDLNAVVQEVVQLLERTTLSKVGLRMELAGGLRPIRGHPGSLFHACMNLCVNAVDAMAENGTLTLRTRNEDGAWVELQVEDTGCGMSGEVLARAMESFFTTKEVGKGTGLGLSMVHGTVQAHRGFMEIRSEPGQGTCVRIRLPASRTPAQDPPEPQTVLS